MRACVFARVRDRHADCTRRMHPEVLAGHAVGSSNAPLSTSLARPVKHETTVLASGDPFPTEPPSSAGAVVAEATAAVDEFDAMIVDEFVTLPATSVRVSSYCDRLSWAPNMS